MFSFIILLIAHSFCVNIRIPSVTISRPSDYIPTYSIDGNTLNGFINYTMNVVVENNGSEWQAITSMNSKVEILDESTFEISNALLTDLVPLKLRPHRNTTGESLLPLNFNLDLALLSEYHPSLDQYLKPVYAIPTPENVLNLAHQVSSSFPQYPLWRFIRHISRSECLFFDGNAIDQLPSKNDLWTLLQYDLTFNATGSPADLQEAKGKVLMYCPLNLQ